MFPSRVRTVITLVEPGGIEPPSENTSTGTSPGAESHLHSLTQAWTITLEGLVASLCMVRSKLCVLTDAVNRCPTSRPRHSWRGHSLLKQREEQFCCCSLIYKFAHFMDGRRIRPLFRIPHPRRNQYGPMGSREQNSRLINDA